MFFVLQFIFLQLNSYIIIHHGWQRSANLLSTMEQPQVQLGRDSRCAHQDGMLRRLHDLCRRAGPVQSASCRSGGQFTLFPSHFARRSHGSLHNPISRSTRVRNASAPGIHVYRRGKCNAVSDPSDNEDR